jgi:hypothetical protein
VAANATKRKVFDPPTKDQPRISVAESLGEFFRGLGHPAQTLAFCQFPFAIWRRKVNTKEYATWRISPEVRTTYSEDGAVLLDIDKGLCYSLNPVAARVWSTVEASRSGIDLCGLVDVMETHYTISREQLERDVDECLSKLENMGLVQRNGLFHGSQAAGVRG